MSAYGVPGNQLLFCVAGIVLKINVLIDSLIVALNNPLYPSNWISSEVVLKKMFYQPLTLLYTIFHEKGTPIDKWYPFHISCLEPVNTFIVTAVKALTCK